MHRASEHPALVLLWDIFLTHYWSNCLHYFLFFSFCISLKIRLEAFRNTVIKSINTWIESRFSFSFLHSARIKSKTFFIFAWIFLVFLSDFFGISYFYFNWPILFFKYICISTWSESLNEISFKFLSLLQYFYHDCNVYLRVKIR